MSRSNIEQKVHYYNN